MGGNYRLRSRESNPIQGSRPPTGAVRESCLYGRPHAAVTLVPERREASPRSPGRDSGRGCHVSRTARRRGRPGGWPGGPRAGGRPTVRKVRILASRQQEPRPHARPGPTAATWAHARASQRRRDVRDARLPGRRTATGTGPARGRRQLPAGIRRRPMVVTQPRQRSPGGELHKVLESSRSSHERPVGSPRRRQGAPERGARTRPV